MRHREVVVTIHLMIWILTFYYIEHDMLMCMHTIQLMTQNIQDRILKSMIWTRDGSNKESISNRQPSDEFI